MKFRMGRQNSMLAVSAVIALLVAVAPVAAQQKAEGSGKKGEKADGPQAVARFVAAHQQGGAFAIFDPRTEEALALELTDIHAGAHPVESGEVYYCADFRDADGTLYDLDFYVDESGARPVVVETFIHKVAGEDRIRPKEGSQPAGSKVATQVKDAISRAWKSGQTLTDPRSGERKSFTFEGVHETVKPVAGGAYFACVDARDQAGVLYDLDTYVVRQDDGSFAIAQTLIHKEGGKERLRMK